MLIGRGAPDRGEVTALRALLRGVRPDWDLRLPARFCPALTAAPRQMSGMVQGRRRPVGTPKDPAAPARARGAP